MGDRERPDQETVGAKPAMRMERQRADGGSDECPEGDEKGGRGAKSGGRQAELEAERRGEVEETDEPEHEDERNGTRGIRQRPPGDLRHHDRKGSDSKPFPPPPDEHGGDSRKRDEEDRKSVV